MNTVEIIDADPPVPALVPMMDLIERGITNGASVDVMAQLMSLYERAEANAARKAFDAAMAAAKAEIKVIPKTRQAHHYRYEDMGDIAETVAPALAKHGLHYRFEPDSPPDTDRVTVTCIVSHSAGHSVRATLSSRVDAGRNMNHSQAVGSVCTYLQRYTLKAALGLAAAVDDDAQSDKKPGRTGDDYAEEWEGLLDKATKQDEAALRLKWGTETKLREKIDWDDSEQRFALQERVKDAFARLKALPEAPK